MIVRNDKNLFNKNDLLHCVKFVYTYWYLDNEYEVLSI